jgi:hypothetical protein
MLLNAFWLKLCHNDSKSMNLLSFVLSVFPLFQKKTVLFYAFFPLKRAFLLFFTEEKMKIKGK